MILTVATAEHDWQARRRSRRAAMFGYGALLLCVVIVSAWVSEVFPETLARGLPQVGVYFRKLIPALTWDHLLDGPKTEGALAYWFYRLDSWAWMLFETTQIAALATLFGAIAALCPVLCIVLYYMADTARLSKPAWVESKHVRTDFEIRGIVALCRNPRRVSPRQKGF